ncbi:MAG: phosphate ABC transporter permease PstA [Anaeroplasmataceae bacterium]
MNEVIINEELNDNKKRKKSARKLKDNVLNSITYIASSLGILILAAIIIFVFSNGITGLSWDKITGNYYPENISISITPEKLGGFEDPESDKFSFSKKWGAGFTLAETKNGEKYITVSYIDPNSPLLNVKNVNDTNEYYSFKVGHKIETGIIVNEIGKRESINISKYESSNDVSNFFDRAIKITNMNLSKSGGGFRGSLITTLYLILFTLIIAIPIGVGGAVYLNEYAKDNKFTKIIRTMIEITSGIPSIIFGMVGALVFIPFTNTVIGSNGGNILAGALTMSIVLLPIIIRTTEEALKVVPDGLRQASLALGASKTETIFKVVLPNAISGILTSVILSVGRIIGESAALIFVIGTVVKDNIILNERSTSLALQIWTLMSGENPDFESACAIAIIILGVVLVLSILVKFISKKLNKFEVQ